MLEKEGYTVHVRMEGLGQIPEIQKIFVDHIRFGLKHRTQGIMEKKAVYAAGEKTSEKVTFSCHNVINRMYLCELQA